MIKTPVILLIFNRPKETARVFECIRKARPPKLFVVADGPRNDAERELVLETRGVIDGVDWPCEVIKNYSEKNLGCRRRVWSGLDWAFGGLEHDTDGAIILEDDCVPDHTFFTFAEEMLHRYTNNSQVMHIGGTCFQQDNPKLSTYLTTELSTAHSPALHKLSTGINLTKHRTKTLNSYYFSHISQIWGWATWKRAWKMYDGSLSSWSEVRRRGLIRPIFPTRTVYHYWRYMFDRMHANEMDTWDVAWTYTVFKEQGLCIMPYTNLIENIGVGASSTHKANRFSHSKTISLSFPLRHPEKIEVSTDADIFTYRKIYGINNSLGNSLKAWTKDTLPFLFKYVKRFMK